LYEKRLETRIISGKNVCRNPSWRDYYIILNQKLITMKKATLYTGGLLLMLSIAGCAGNTTTTTTDSTANNNMQMNPGDSSVTTTTTTTVTHHRYTGNFMPQPTTKYLDLRTKKQINVRIDTTRGSLVNTETNEPVDLLVEPTKHDTIYGQTGTVVNNYIIRDESGYRVDTVRIHEVEQVPAPAAAPAPAPEPATPAKEKTKSKDNGKEKSKTKTQ
jgi:hypothetical protein